jgi:ParB family chromosome partitioning protein
MKGKLRLGKGLEALISTSTDLVSPQLKQTLQDVEVAFIDPNPFQPRLEMDEAAFEELKKSVKERGIIQPVAVRQGKNGRFELITGERRLKAAIAVGLKRIPAYLLNVTRDEDMLEIALIENVQREHLNPIDLANGYQRLIDECNLTQEEVAEKIGKDRATVSNLIRLIKLPEIIQSSLKTGEIKEGHARAILGLQDKKLQIELWKKTVKQGLSVRKVEEAVKKMRKLGGELKIHRLVHKKPAFINRIENRLREKFGTQVKIRTRKEGGNIEITYYSREDLDRLLELFNEIKI